MEKILITPKSKASVAFLKKLLTSLSEVEGIEMVNTGGKSAPKVAAKKVATPAKKTLAGKAAAAAKPNTPKAVVAKAAKAPKSGKKDESSKKKSKKKGK